MWNDRVRRDPPPTHGFTMTRSQPFRLDAAVTLRTSPHSMTSLGAHRTLDASGSTPLAVPAPAVEPAVEPPPAAAAAAEASLTLALSSTVGTVRMPCRAARRQRYDLCAVRRSTDGLFRTRTPRWLATTSVRAMRALQLLSDSEYDQAVRITTQPTSLQSSGSLRATVSADDAVALSLQSCSFARPSHDSSANGTLAATSDRRRGPSSSW